MLHAGGVAREVHVILEVPGVAGDYRGFAALQRVNGKSIPLGKVDLNLAMFAEPAGPTEPRFRAGISRDMALLFPQDVVLYGVFHQGHDFSLTASFLTPTGDRNVPPYTEFQDGKGYGTPKDVDANRDGKLDNLNPFPFAIQREITLQGRRLSPDRIESLYVEAVSGILPRGEVIYVEGTFELDRESIEPTPQPAQTARATGEPVPTGGGVAGRVAYTNTLGISRVIQIQGLTATVKVDFPLPSEIEIQLQHPTGLITAVHAGSASWAPVLSFATASLRYALTG